MGLAQLIARYGAILGKAIWEGMKRGKDFLKKGDPDIKFLRPDADLLGEAEKQAAKKAVSGMKEAASKGRAKKSVQKFKKERDIGADPRYVNPKDTGIGANKNLMNTPAAATALVGTGASLVHNNKSKSK